ncbi:MAG: RNA polymerase sigma factor [Bacteroidota bacterium]
MQTDMVLEKDQQLVSLMQSKEGLERGFRLMYEEYGDNIYWSVFRMVGVHEDANDIVQNILVKIYRNIDSFRHDSKLFTWIYSIMLNETRTYLKQRQRRSIIVPTLHIENLCVESCVNESFSTGNQIQSQFYHAISTLPEKQRLVFKLKHFNREMTFEELSGKLGTSVGALKSSYHLATKKLELMLAQYN